MCPPKLDKKLSGLMLFLVSLLLKNVIMNTIQSLSRNIYITTNTTCNLRCIYCYEQDKSCQDTFNIEQAKETIAKTLIHKTDKGTLINFHGGEPFLSYQKIKELCEWTWKQCFPERYRFFATSNGTLIHGEIQDWLYKNRHRFIVGLSLDGTREMHNLNRSNSFDLIDLNFFVRTWPKQGVKMTISPKTINSLADGLIFIHEKGFQNIISNLAEMMDWSTPEYKTIYRRELKKISEYYINHPEIDKCSLFTIFFAGLINKDVRKWCGAGTEMEAIDVDGRKYPCHLFFESVCGKEKSEKAHTIDFTDPNQYTSEHCRACQLLPICPTCYGSNYIVRGAISLRDISLCELNKVQFVEVAKYEYNRIVNDPTDISALSNEEKYKRIRTLEGIEKLATILEMN